MPDLQGISFADHLDIIFNDYKAHQNIYGYSARKFFYGFPDADLSCSLYGQKIITPLGPAAGPHTQLAQNIVLSFLHGSRIIELKTIQKLDQLEIARPCIDIRNIGYNIEWSQELSLQESYEEYVKAWLLIHIIRHETLLGYSEESDFYNTVFDISAGYDLAGISSALVEKWISGMRDASEKIEQLLQELPVRWDRLKNIKVASVISDSITLSTFHGCPGNEIEEIVKYLISRHKAHVIVKMNPTLAGYDFVKKTVQIDLGYSHIQLEKQAFEQDLNFEQAVEMMKRLQKYAAEYSVSLGAKFTNTLVVKNNETIFREKNRYLSGAPLYVIAMHLVDKFRHEFGADFPISFSGGINRENFSEAVSCGLVPVTTCTDILKKGGYARLPIYLNNLKSKMKESGAGNLKEYIPACAGMSGAENLSASVQKNCTVAAKESRINPDYHYSQNQKPPKKTGSKLALFDCLNCGICLPVCPNAAIFSFDSGPAAWQINNYIYRNKELVKNEAVEFTAVKNSQIGILDSFCNLCGSCDTFCPEDGGPYLIKPRFFLDEAEFMRNSGNDGIYFYSRNHAAARSGKNLFTIKYNDFTKEYIWSTEKYTIEIDDKNEIKHFNIRQEIIEGEEISLKPFLELKYILQSFSNQQKRFPFNLFFKNLHNPLK